MVTLKRKTRKKLKFWGIVLIMMLGVLVAIESRYAIFRINDIQISANRIVPDNAMWGITTGTEEKFWPVYWIVRAKHERLIEAYFPVDITIRLVGWGKFYVDCVPIVPAYKMYWGGKYWYLSPSGKVWLATLGENKYIASDKAEKIPVLSWSSDRPSPVDLSVRRGNIMPSSLPVTRVKKWYENIELLGWNNHVKFVKAEIREGSPVVKLVFSRPDGGNGTEIMFADEPLHWYEAGLAVKKLYPNLTKVSQEIFIDTTYKDKILVKNNVQ